MQYLHVVSKRTEGSQFVSKANHSTSPSSNYAKVGSQDILRIIDMFGLVVNQINYILHS